MTTSVVEDLQTRLAASHVAVEHAQRRLTDAKRDAIAASNNRLAVEALVAGKVVFAGEMEVVAVRTADAAASEQVAEAPARHAAEVAERERRMDAVERSAPQLRADLEEARERLAEVSRYEVPDGATPSVGGRAHQARQRVVTLERELNERLAEAPNEVAPPTSARGKR